MLCSHECRCALLYHKQVPLRGLTTLELCLLAHATSADGTVGDQSTHTEILWYVQMWVSIRYEHSELRRGDAVNSFICNGSSGFSHKCTQTIIEVNFACITFETLYDINVLFQNVVWPSNGVRSLLPSFDSLHPRPRDNWQWTCTLSLHPSCS